MQEQTIIHSSAFLKKMNEEAKMLSRDTQAVLSQAVQFARDFLHEFVTAEHLLLSLSNVPEVQDMIHSYGGDLDVLQDDLEDHLEHSIESLSEKDYEGYNPDVTLAFQRIVQRSVLQVQSSGRDLVEPLNLVVALFEEQDSYALYFLKKQGLKKLNVTQFISHDLRLQTKALQVTSPDGEPLESNRLEDFCVNLNKKALSGKIDPLIGRHDILERIQQTLCRRTKNNPLLIGDPGVGKTAIVEGLALSIVEGTVPEPIKNATVFSLDLGKMLAGTKYRGDFEERIKLVLDEILKEENGVLFIDEIHTIVGAGGTQGGSMDASNLLKPALSDGSLKCIGSTTHKEYRSNFEKDRALSRRFQRIDVEEPTIQETIEILKGLASRFEKHHSVKYKEDSLEAAAKLSSRYMTGRFLPDKAIDIVDETGARFQIKRSKNENRTIEVADIEETISLISGVPVHTVTLDDRERLVNLEDQLKLFIYGQDKAVDALSTAIKVSRVGLGRDNNPMGSFLFAGPTGVGKTELAKQLASILGIEFIRFDMSEYMEKHAVSRLVGAPPGYVGYEDGGQLTEAVHKNPYSVVLLDEIEKAHPDIYNIMLQVMDNGELTDSNGKKSDFRNTIIIMTSNAGAKEMSQTPIGFGTTQLKGISMEAIKKTFAPEFINRLDGIIEFSSLSEDVLLRVVGKMMMELQEQASEKGLNLKANDEVLKWIMKTGYDPLYGARPMARVINEHVKKPLVDEMLSGKWPEGSEISLSIKNSKVHFSGKKKSPPKKKSKVKA